MLICWDFLLFLPLITLFSAPDKGLSKTNLWDSGQGEWRKSPRITNTKERHMFSKLRSGRRVQEDVEGTV